MLSERYRVPQISTGDLLREVTKSRKKLAREVKETMDSGKLVEDDVVLDLLDERLRRKDTKRGFIIDGYPRSIPQAQSLDALLGLLGRALQVAIYMEVGDDVLVKRIAGRYSCASCGAIYNRHFSPPAKAGVCDQCGSKKFASRKDDNTRSVQTRISLYHSETAPLITYYRAQHKLRTLSGIGDKEQIHEHLCEMIDLEIRPLEIKTLDTAADSVYEQEKTVIAGGKINRVESPKKSARKVVRKAASVRVAGKTGSAASRAKKTGKTAARKKPPPRKSASRRSGSA